MKRAEFLKNLGYMLGGATLVCPTTLHASPSDKILMPKTGEDFDTLDLKLNSLKPDVEKPVTVIIIGAGGRGNVYAGFAKRFPEAMQIVGVSDINEYRKTTMAKTFKLTKEQQFGDYSEVFKKPKMADVIVISTTDDVHYPACMKALEMGYDILLEKPIAPTEKECKDILAMTKKTGRMVAVCHVLRYAPYFMALKKAIDTGLLGDILHIQHLEPVSFEHFSHSYVRGNWHNSKKASPMILAKCCHDLDILCWLIGKPCKTVSADGSLTFFTSKNAPEDAPERCTDGCPHESTCVYSAIKIYAEKKRWSRVFDLPSKADKSQFIEKLRTTNYGKCVFRSENDQPDHYTVDMTFERGTTASFNAVYTSYSGRRTRIMGTKGDIVGDMNEFVLTDYQTMKKTIWNKKVMDVDEYANAGHGGGDLALVSNFITAVGQQKPEILTSSLAAAIESHLIGFRAEKSRKTMVKYKL